MFLNPGRKGFSPLLLFLFGIPFLVLGAFVSWSFGLKPALMTWESESWVQVPCSITVSELVRSRTERGHDIYNLKIEYDYTIEGRQYTGNRYGFNDLGSSEPGTAANLARELFPGREVNCWVDPNNPEVAVLDRSIPSNVIVLLGIGLVFCVVGLGFIVRSLRTRSNATETLATAASTIDRTSGLDRAGREVMLAQSASPKRKLAILLFATAFWDAIVAVFVFDVIRGFDGGNPDWLLTLFLIPFVLVGGLLILGVVYYGLALFNPKPTLFVSRADPHLGESIHLRWQLRGAVHRLRSIEVALEGRERASYLHSSGKGRSRRSERSVFCRDVVHRAAGQSLKWEDAVELTIPADSMHSFNATNNQIDWAIWISGEIGRGPNLEAEFPIRILPYRTDRLSQ